MTVATMFLLDRVTAVWDSVPAHRELVLYLGALALFILAGVYLIVSSMHTRTVERVCQQLEVAFADQHAADQQAAARALAAVQPFSSRRGPRAE